MEAIGKTARKALGVFALLTMIPVSGWAFGGPGMGGWSQGPPQEAFDACAAKKAGDTVQFTTPRGDNVAAVCREFDGKLVAAPGWRGMGFGRGDGYSCWEGKGPRGGGRGMGMGRGKGMGMDRGRHFERMADDLGLTPEQKGQIKSIMDDEREKSAALHKQLRDGRGELRKVAQKMPFDEAAVRKTADEKEKARVELAVSKARAMNKVYAVLTPEQREKADKFGPFGMGYGPGRHGRHQGR